MQYFFVSVQSVQSLSHVQLFLTHGLQYAGTPCPSPTPGACSNSCPLSQWCHPIISSSVVPFSSCLQSFPSSGSFQMSHVFTSGIQSTGASASASVLPMKIQDWFALGLTSLISLQSKGLSRVFSNTTVQKVSILWCSAVFIVQLSHPYMTTGKTIALTRRNFVTKVISQLFTSFSGINKMVYGVLITSGMTSGDSPYTLDSSLFSSLLVKNSDLEGPYSSPGFPGGLNGKKSAYNIIKYIINILNNNIIK